MLLQMLRSASGPALVFFFQAEDGIRDLTVTGVQTCALPISLDRKAYRDAVELLTERGLIERGRLTRYGRDVEAMPVERPWGELLYHADPDLVPMVAVAASVESLHRMTREEREDRKSTRLNSSHSQISY